MASCSSALPRFFLTPNSKAADPDPKASEADGTGCNASGGEAIGAGAATRLSEPKTAVDDGCCGAAAVLSARLSEPKTADTAPKPEAAVVGAEAAATASDGRLSLVEEAGGGAAEELACAGHTKQTSASGTPEGSRPL